MHAAGAWSFRRTHSINGFVVNLFENISEICYDNVIVPSRKKLMLTTLERP